MTVLVSHPAGGHRTGILLVGSCPSLMPGQPWSEEILRRLVRDKEWIKQLQLFLSPSFY
jgi:hypothetical protein